jgi:WD40 domain-containing protein
MKPSPLRFSLATLMIVVALVAVACAALHYATELWASALMTITVGLLLVGVLGACLREGPSRTFCLGWSIFGWAYLVLALNWFGAGASQQLLSTKLLAYVHPRLQQNASVPLTVDFSLPLNTAQGANLSSLAFSPDGEMLTTAGSDGAVRIWSTTNGKLVTTVVGKPSWEHFERVGHALFALLAATCGGAVAVLLARRTATPDKSP